MSEEFSAGVNILLQRMETNPEEFYEENSKTKLTNPRWGNLMSLVVTSKLKGEPISDTIYLTPAEIDALYEGYKKIRRKSFDDYVMRTVLAPKEELSSATHQIIKNSTYGWSDPAQQTASEQLNAYRQQQLQGMQNSISTLGLGAINYPYDTQPEPQSMMSQIAKRIGLK